MGSGKFVNVCSVKSYSKISKPPKPSALSEVKYKTSWSKNGKDSLAIELIVLPKFSGVPKTLLPNISTLYKSELPKPPGLSELKNRCFLSSLNAGWAVLYSSEFIGNSCKFFHSPFTKSIEYIFNKTKLDLLKPFFLLE